MVVREISHESHGKSRESFGRTVLSVPCHGKFIALHNQYSGRWEGLVEYPAAEYRGLSIPAHVFSMAWYKDCDISFCSQVNTSHLKALLTVEVKRDFL